MPCQAAQRGNAARAESLFLELVRGKGAPGRWCLKCAGAAVDNPLYLRNRQLAAGGHCCDLALTNWVGNCRRQRVTSIPSRTGLKAHPQRCASAASRILRPASIISLAGNQRRRSLDRSSPGLPYRVS